VIVYNDSDDRNCNSSEMWCMCSNKNGRTASIIIELKVLQVCLQSRIHYAYWERIEGGNFEVVSDRY
jgi:hypothetical protein